MSIVGVPTSHNHYLLGENPALLTELINTLQDNDAYGFFLIARIKKFGRLQDKYPQEIDELTTEIVKQIQLAFPQYIYSVVNEKYFFVIAQGANQNEQESIVEDIQALIETSSFTNKSIKLAVTFGIAIFPDDSQIAEEIFTKAYLALKAVSSHDERGYLFFNEFIENQSSLLKNKNMAKRLKSAMKENRIFLAFQPIVNSKAHNVLYHECMLKIEGDDDLLAIDDYIAVAEKFGFIKFVDELVLDLVVDELNKYKNIRLSVNVSSFGINNQVWLNKAAILLADPDISNRLTIELSEKIIHRELQASTKFIKQVHQLGCKVLIDNFGFGYTSFALLKSLPIDAIKIDGFFIQGIINNANSEFFIKSVVEMKKSLKITIAAEFVEGEDVAKKLTQLGVDELQGSLFGAVMDKAKRN